MAFQTALRVAYSYTGTHFKEMNETMILCRWMVTNGSRQQCMIRRYGSIQVEGGGLFIWGTGREGHFSRSWWRIQMNQSHHSIWCKRPFASNDRRAILQMQFRSGFHNVVLFPPACLCEIQIGSVGWLYGYLLKTPKRIFQCRWTQGVSLDYHRSSSSRSHLFNPATLIHYPSPS